MSFARLGITTRKGREAWAKERSMLLRLLSRPKADPPVIATTEPITTAVEEFLEQKLKRVAPPTARGYVRCLKEFAAWCQAQGIEETGDLEASDLERFRDHVLARPRTERVPGGRRETGRPLTAGSRNVYFDTLKVFLRKCWRLEMLPGLDMELVADRLRPVREVRDTPEFLRGAAIRELLVAALRHDEERAPPPPGRSSVRGPRPPEIAPFTLTLLLGGFRPTEACRLEWCEVDLQVGEIRLPGKRTKTGRSRTITLVESPVLCELLSALERRTGHQRFVFTGRKPLSAPRILRARYCLMTSYGAPPFTWRMLRRTCGTYLTCAPAIFGGASAFLSAKRLGHSVAIAEKHYVGVLRGIPKSAKTLEAAMGIRDLAEEIVRRADWAADANG